MITPTGHRNGYRLVLPPGWQRIPLRASTEEVVDAMLDRSFAGVPRDSATPMRLELRRRLLARATEARDCGGLDLYLPVERRHDVTLPGSFVVSQVAAGDPAGPMAGVLAGETGDIAGAAATDVLAMVLASSAHAAPAEVGGQVAVRSDRVVPADPTRPGNGDRASRRVDYVVPVPGESAQWVIVTFSTIGAGGPDDDLARILVELFDAMMTTFRWVQPAPAAPVTLQAATGQAATGQDGIESPAGVDPAITGEPSEERGASPQ